jgi:hypothetical protein
MEGGASDAGKHPVLAERTLLVMVTGRVVMVLRMGAGIRAIP